MFTMRVERETCAAKSPFDDRDVFVLSDQLCTEVVAQTRSKEWNSALRSEGAFRVDVAVNSAVVLVVIHVDSAHSIGVAAGPLRRCRVTLRIAVDAVSSRCRCAGDETIHSRRSKNDPCIQARHMFETRDARRQNNRRPHGR